MSRLIEIIEEDNNLMKDVDYDGAVLYKLAQISATLAMILDAIVNAESLDDGR